MDKFTSGVTDHKKSIIIIFLLLALLSVVSIPLVTVNYKLSDYLPKDAQTTKAIRVMEEEFGGEFPNARVMITDVTIQVALKYKQAIAAVNGVTRVDWLDDAVGLNTLTATPVEFLDSSIVESYYKDNCALFTITIKSGREKSTVRAIYSLIGKENAIAGDAVNTALFQEMSVSEVIKAMSILLPVIIIVLILSTTSWLEPLLFLVSIGIAVIINMGTNIFFGTVSFITQAVSPVLQLAVSLDYAIFLLHSFKEYRMQYEPEEAMKLAMKKSVAAVAASALTTVIGFLALIFMRFGIGADLGIILVKGVLLSFISSMVLLPAITLAGYRIMDKTKHRKLIPDFKAAGKWLMKIRIPFLILAVIIVVPCFLAQSNIEFKYGSDIAEGTTRTGRDRLLIEKRFGRENQLVLLVPKGDTGKELELCDELADIGHVTGVISYVSLAGAEIPLEYLPEDTVNQFYSKNYARIILSTDMAEEGAQTFATVKNVRNTAAKYYDVCYLAGQSAALYDMKNIVSSDTKLVNLIAVIGILLILMLTFRSLSLPLILLMTIETAIWANLSFAYFSNLSFNFIGYLVISTVQLGSTVDYAILLTDRYMGYRKELPKKEAMKSAIGNNLIAIITSALILSSAGYALMGTSSNPIVSELGRLLGRGTILSFLMVVCVLPALLVLFDKLIQKTTIHSKNMN